MTGDAQACQDGCHRLWNSQCFFILNEKKQNKHFEGTFLGRLEKKVNILGDFLRKIIKNKGKIVLEARNNKKNRLRRAKMEDSIAMLVQNGPNLAKIAPEGRDFLESKLFSF